MAELSKSTTSTKFPKLTRRTRSTRRCAASALAFALTLASGGCETGHATPEPGRNPPPPPQRLPRAIDVSPGTGVHLLSNELSDEEAEKLKQRAKSEEPAPQESAPE